MKFWHLNDEGELVEEDGCFVIDGETYESLAEWWVMRWWRDVPTVPWEGM